MAISHDGDTAGGRDLGQGKVTSSATMGRYMTPNISTHDFFAAEIWAVDSSASQKPHSGVNKGM